MKIINIVYYEVSELRNELITRQSVALCKYCLKKSYFNNTLKKNCNLEKLYWTIVLFI